MNEPIHSFLYETLIIVAALVPTIISVVELIQRFGS